MSKGLAGLRNERDWLHAAWELALRDRDVALRRAATAEAALAVAREALETIRDTVQDPRHIAAEAIERIGK